MRNRHGFTHALRMGRPMHRPRQQQRQPAKHTQFSGRPVWIELSIPQKCDDTLCARCQWRRQNVRREIILEGQRTTAMVHFGTIKVGGRVGPLRGHRGPIIKVSPNCLARGRGAVEPGLPGATATTACLGGAARGVPQSAPEFLYGGGGRGGRRRAQAGASIYQRLAPLDKGALGWPEGRGTGGTAPAR